MAQSVLLPGRQLVPQRDGGPDHDQQRGGAGRLVRHPVQCRDGDGLFRPCRIPDQRHRVVLVAARRQQPRGDGAKLAAGHVEHQDIARGGPVQVGHVPRQIVAGGEGDGAGNPAVGQRNAGGRGASDARADPGHDAERNAGGGERERLLPTAAEDQWIAPLKPNHPPSLGRQSDQPLVDPQLRGPASARPLAGRFFPRAGRQGKNFLRNQSIMENDVGLFQSVQGMQREQPRIARPGTDEPDGTRVEGWRDERGREHEIPLKGRLSAFKSILFHELQGIAGK